MARHVVTRISFSLCNVSVLRSVAERASFVRNSEIKFCRFLRPFTSDLRRAVLSTLAVRTAEVAGRDAKRVSEERVDEIRRRKLSGKLERVNRMIGDHSFGRPFAVVHLGGTQHKITAEDTIVVNKLHVEPGARILLNKVLLIGTKHFTLVGQPLVSKDVVSVEATVTEQTRTKRIIVFKKKRRKNYKRTRGHRQDVTVLRINRIDLRPHLK
ncbi:large ribosomal subunit protein bL21m-like [Corticium candelabrum]|uniref:large ribosomal subunit protein bL21m-like n=1 Tax=Corticium candelabrum TaxID=121492 RepID=UPI002E2663C4|nr:large ribosomal subunit protein bL21m-like [Corticium candelabrum]